MREREQERVRVDYGASREGESTTVEGTQLGAEGNEKMKKITPKQKKGPLRGASERDTKGQQPGEQKQAGSQWQWRGGTECEKEWRQQ